MTAEDNLKKAILDIINDKKRPLKAKEIEELGGTVLHNLILDARTESGLSIDNPKIFYRYIGTKLFQLWKEKLIKEIDKIPKDDSPSNKFISIGASYSPSETAIPAPKAKPAPTTTTTIKPKFKNPVGIKITNGDLVHTYNKKFHAVAFNTEKVHDALLKHPDRLSLLIPAIADNANIERTTENLNEILLQVLALISVHFSSEDIVKAIGMGDENETRNRIKIYDEASLLRLSKNFIVNSSYPTDDTNILIGLIALKNFADETMGVPLDDIETTESKPSKKLKELTPDDITLEDILSGFGDYRTIDEVIEVLNKEEIFPLRITKNILKIKESQGYSVGSITEAEKVISVGVDNIISKYEASLPAIDNRIDLTLTPGLEERISSKSLTKVDKDIIYEMRLISTQIDDLVSHLNDSTDYEIIAIKLQLNKEGKLPLAVWQRILTHKLSGTSFAISDELLPLYLKLKVIINRINYVTIPEDREELIKLYLEMPGRKAPLPHQSVSLIENYFSKLSTQPVTKPDRDAFDNKLDILDSVLENKRITSNLRALLEANEIQQAHMIALDNMLHENAPKLSKNVLDIGKSKYSAITLITPESEQDRLLNSTSSRIVARTAKEVAEEVKELFNADDDIVEELYQDFLAGKDTHYNRGLLYIYHREKIDPVIYNLISNLIK